MIKHNESGPNDDDTEGHSVIIGEEPSAAPRDEVPSVTFRDGSTPSTDDDDTAGHIFYRGQEPGLSGALSTDPETQS